MGRREVLSAVSNDRDDAPVSAFVYANDALGRRMARADSDGQVVTEK